MSNKEIIKKLKDYAELAWVAYGYYDLKMKTFKNIILLSSILAINLTFFGCMNFVPYAMQPSYYEVKKICELNKLPNNEEKYNKVLAYFGKSLDTLDWEELNKNKFKLNKDYGSYVPNIIEYRVTVLKQENEKYEYDVTLYANQKGFSKENITFIQTYANFFHTRRYHLKKRSVASYELEWREEEFDCYDLGTMYNIPSFFKNKGLNYDKQRTNQKI